MLVFGVAMGVFFLVLFNYVFGGTTTLLAAITHGRLNDDLEHHRQARADHRWNLRHRTRHRRRIASRANVTITSGA